MTKNMFARREATSNLLKVTLSQFPPARIFIADISTTLSASDAMKGRRVVMKYRRSSTSFLNTNCFSDSMFCSAGCEEEEAKRRRLDMRSKNIVVFITFFSFNSIRIASRRPQCLSS